MNAVGKLSANLPRYVGKVYLDSRRRNQSRIIVPHISHRSAHFPRLHFLSRIWSEQVNRQMRWLCRSHPQFVVLPCHDNRHSAVNGLQKFVTGVLTVGVQRGHMGRFRGRFVAVAPSAQRPCWGSRGAGKEAGGEKETDRENDRVSYQPSYKAKREKEEEQNHIYI